MDEGIATATDRFIGKRLEGGYVIEELIGSGAMANVYRAEQTNLRRTVAVKVLHAHLVHDETTGRRFINEARAASRLNHPHSLAVIDFGRMDNEQPYMVMEFLRGRDLDRVVREDGPLAFTRVIDILLQLLDALSEAHELDILHRDLKPENIVIEPVRRGGDFVKVVDFGLAKLMSKDDVSITATGTVCGTPDFMSPEQCRGDKLDARSDLYAVGVNLFVLLTGRVPFLADTPTQALLLHLTADAPDPREVAPDRLILESLAEVTLRALAKDPGDRFPSADAFAEALEQCKRELGAEQLPSVPLRATTVRCAECGAFSAAGTKFCVECGAPVACSVALPAGAPRPLPSQISSQLSLVGRDKVLVALLDPLQAPRPEAKGFLLRGEPGVGKTRVIQEYVRRAERRGHLIVHVEPDAWMVGVAYHGLRRAITVLANLPPDGGDPAGWTGASSSARYGLRQVFGKGAAPGDDERSHRLALRDALAWAVARPQTDNAVTVIVFDDMQFIDAASRRALCDVLDAGSSAPLFVIGTHAPDFQPCWPDTSGTIDIERLPPGEATLVLDQSGLQGRLLELPDQPVTPLFLEQALRAADDGTGRSPSRLGDLIQQRLVHLDAVGREVLQAITVLGANAQHGHICRLIDHDQGVHEALAALTASGLIKHRDRTYCFSHHLLRELVLHNIPLGVFRDLCVHALTLPGLPPVPMEVRVWLMLGAEESFDALVALDQLGAAALKYECADTAVDAYRKGLDVARAELVRGNLDDPMHAVVVFGRKLGEALTAAGRASDGEGVLREVLDFAPQSTSDQARIMLALARATYIRTRVSDAIAWARRASRAANDSGDMDLRQAVEGLIRQWGG